jgi:hypothetical protein
VTNSSNALQDTMKEGEAITKANLQDKINTQQERANASAARRLQQESSAEEIANATEADRASTEKEMEARRESAEAAASAEREKREKEQADRAAEFEKVRAEQEAERDATIAAKEAADKAALEAASKQLEDLARGQKELQAGIAQSALTQPGAAAHPAASQQPATQHAEATLEGAEAVKQPAIAEDSLEDIKANDTTTQDTNSTLMDLLDEDKDGKEKALKGPNASHHSAKANQSAQPQEPNQAIKPPPVKAHVSKTAAKAQATKAEDAKAAAKTQSAKQEEPKSAAKVQSAKQETKPTEGKLVDDQEEGQKKDITKGAKEAAAPSE